MSQPTKSKTSPSPNQTATQTATREPNGPRDATPPPTMLEALEAPVVAHAGIGSPELHRALAEVKGQAQFLLYLADQIEDSLEQLGGADDAGHSAFLCKVLGMYSAQLESKHQGLGDKIAETCQEVYV